MSNAALLKVYDGQEPDLCFGAAPGPGGVNSVGVGLGLTQTGSNANPVVNLGMSAVGDLLVGSGVNTGVVLGLGAAGDFLRVNLAGTDLEYAVIAPGGVNSVAAGAGLTSTGTAANPVVNLGMSAVGDLLVGTGVANSGSVLSKGANGQFLRVNLAGTGLEYAAVAPGGVTSVAVGAGLTQTGTASDPIVNLGMTAVGDLLVGSAVNTGVVLGLGAAGDFLRVNLAGTGLEYAVVAPGGVDSVSAIANNVGLLLTTAPASPTDPQIGLAFTAKADIPVGTAGGAGIMCSAPLPLTSGLVLQTDTTEPSGVKWAPAAGPTGVISTLAPLNDDFSAGNNTISIAYTAGVKGEIPVGGGTLNTGLMLPCSGIKGDVLSVLPTAPSGLAWVTPSSGGGGSKILRGTAGVPTAVGTPSTASDTLIIIAEENLSSESWVPVPLPGFTPPAAYNMEFEVLPYVLPNGGGTALVYGVNTIVNSQKVVEVYIAVGQATPTPLGHFYNSLSSVVGKYDYAAAVAQCITGPAGGPGNLENSFLFCGTFDFFHFENQSTPTPDIETHNIAQLTFNAQGVPSMGRLFAQGVPQGTFGLGLTQTQPQIVYNTQVNRMVIRGGGGSLVVTFLGCFNATQVSAGDMTTGGGDPVAGYASIIDYNVQLGDFVSAAQMLNEGNGVYANNFPAQPAGVGNIAGIQVISATKYFIVGEWSQLAINAGAQFPTPPGFTGHALYDFSFPTNKWAGTPGVPSPVPGSVFGNGYGLKEAVSLSAGFSIFTGEEYSTAGDVEPRVYIYDSVNNVISQMGGVAATLNNLSDTIGFYNGITGVDIDIGQGSTLHDFISVLNFTDPTAPAFKVLFITGNSPNNSTFLLPNPTGLVSSLYPPTTPGAALYYFEPDTPSFGINNTFGNPNIPNLILGANNSKEQWTAAQGAVGIAFTGDFYFDNANFTTATFAPTAGTNLDSAQMLVSTKDQLGWINVGAKATSLTYS